MTTTLPGLSPSRIYRSSHIMSLMTYVSSGLGVAFVPAPIPSLRFPGVAFVTIKDAIPKLQMELLWAASGASATVVNYLDCAEEANDLSGR
jgi:DNA-binding transcriptional LysR family regulator